MYARGAAAGAAPVAHLRATKKFKAVRQNGGAVAFVVDDIASVDPWVVRGVEIRGTAEPTRWNVTYQAALSGRPALGDDEGGTMRARGQVGTVRPCRSPLGEGQAVHRSRPDCGCPWRDAAPHHRRSRRALPRPGGGSAEVVNPAARTYSTRTSR